MSTDYENSFKFSIRKLKPNLNKNFKIPKNIEISPTIFNISLACILSLFYNFSFWEKVIDLPYKESILGMIFLFTLLLFMISILNLLLLTTTIKYIQKPIAICIIFIASIASYFMNTYGILIDKSMIQNMFETDVKEASELFSIQLLLYITLFGALPSLLILKVKIKGNTLRMAIISRLISALSSILIISLIIITFYQDYSSFFRNNRYLRHLITPTNFVYATSKYVSETFSADKAPPKAIALDAKRSLISANGKHNLTILVVGEAARAANFSLNGYSRKTNPNLENQDIINFTNTSSCGTATAVSVPCMFSKFERENYSHSKSKEFEGLLDILARVGISVLWRDNNSGCKGTCDRVPTDFLSNSNVDLLCNENECFDEILLHDLDKKIESLNKDIFIVLHQKGSHGPSYYQRYPKEYEIFKPICKTNQLQDCNRQEIINAYDNSILYTDYFLSRVINLLESKSMKYNTSMIYISDHGESLGENNIYLHGIPYFMAPSEQTHIPFLVWFSDDYKKAIEVDYLCMKKKQDLSFSQDNLFHSILGINNINTKTYKKELDIFSSCRND